MQERVLVTVILTISLRFKNRGISNRGKKGWPFCFNCEPRHEIEHYCLVLEAIEI